MSLISRPITRPRLKRSVASNIAAILAFCYAVALLGVIVAVLVAVIDQQGTIGHLTGYARRGPIVLSLLLLIGVADLVLGAIMVWRGRRGFLLMVPLAVIIIVGSIGEAADIIGGSSLPSNLIGFGIIVLAIIPVVLLLLPREPLPAS